jgi:hypothetical protein
MLSVIITWRNRLELETSLAHNLPLLEAMRCEWELLVVNGGGDKSLLQSILSSTRCPRLRVLDVPQPEFNKSFCINAGVAKSSGDMLLLLDGDILIDASFVEVISNPLPKDAFLTVKTVVETHPGAPPITAGRTEPFLTEMVQVTTLVGVDGRSASYEYRCGYDGSRCGPGIIVVHRSHFLGVGGFNSALSGWGFEDYDFHVRLQFALGLKPNMIASVVHLTHAAADAQEVTHDHNKGIAYTNYMRRQFLGTLKQDLAIFAQKSTVETSSRSAPGSMLHSGLGAHTSTSAPTTASHRFRPAQSIAREAARPRWPEPSTAALEGV